MNLPTKITFDNYNVIYFIYDAAGQKHQKITRDVNSYSFPFETVYNYVNGIEYKSGVLQRFAHTEGSVSLQSDNVSYKHEYVLKDHLGNTRVTYSNESGTVTVADIKQINHYYPFGLNMEGNWNGSFADAKNKYQFNEKELNSDFDLNQIDYTYRWYDPAVARFIGVDRLASKYPHYTPYQFAGNKVPNAIDLDGLEEVYHWELQRVKYPGFAKTLQLAYDSQLFGETVKNFQNGNKGVDMYVMAEPYLGDTNGETTFFENSKDDRTNDKGLLSSIAARSYAIELNKSYDQSESPKDSKEFLNYINEKSVSKGHSVVLIKLNMGRFSKADLDKVFLNKTTFTMIHEMEFHGVPMKSGKKGDGNEQHQKAYKLPAPSATSPEYEDINPTSRAGEIKKIIEKTKKL